MRKYKAEELFNLSDDELWKLPEERHIVVFQDGEITTHTRATIASVYLWWPAKFHSVPLRKKYHLGDRRFTSKSMLQVMNQLIWDIHDHNGNTVDTERLAELAFRAVNRFYNVFTVRLSPYVATLSMFDALEVMNHPKIKEANDNVVPTEYSIEEVCYKQISEVLLDPNELKGNPIAESVKSGTLSMGQVLQCVGPRGYITDINSEIFPEPITTGYLQGIADLYGSMIESRMGTKSLAYNRELLRDTEYFNRKTQLIAQYVQNLHHGDCGTPHLIEFPVLKNLLRHMKGKYYISPETGKLVMFQGNEEHLVGTKVKMRGVLGCIHPDPAGICSTCYGELAKNIPYGTNIGQVSAVVMGDKITSSVLSTKHHDSTSRVERFDIQKTEGKYLRYGKEPETLYLNRNLKGKKIKLLVFRHEVSSLADVLMLNDLSDYPPATASQLTQMRIVIDNGPEGTTSDLLRVSLYNRKASFSRELLEFIRRKPWTYDEHDNVVIDIEGFDVNQPFLTLPYMHVNMHEVKKRIEWFLHSGSEDTGKRLRDPNKKEKRQTQKYLRSYKDPVEGLLTFANMINEKLSLNLVHCEILVFAMMARNPRARDYRLPLLGLEGSYEKYNELMMNRSLGGTMAYEGQVKAFLSPRSFIYRNRDDHPYDFIIKGGRLQD